MTNVYVRQSNTLSKCTIHASPEGAEIITADYYKMAHNKWPLQSAIAEDLE